MPTTWGGKGAFALPEGNTCTKPQYNMPIAQSTTEQIILNITMRLHHQLGAHGSAPTRNHLLLVKVACRCLVIITQHHVVMSCATLLLPTPVVLLLV